MAEWPEGARGALSLSFDNLGEAAELELGAEPSAPLGEHPTATRSLPAVLAALADRDLAATFFVEGLNIELYPRQLREIDAAGHELGYHAWRHEQWADLGAAEQAENLARGLAGFRSLGIGVSGLRPPGGGLGTGGVDVPCEAGLTYCSPAGKGAGAEDGVALLPFQWRHVDAACLLPGLEPVREQVCGSPGPVDPGAFLTHLEAEIGRLASDGGYAAIVLHLSLFDWLGAGRLGALLDRAADAAADGDVWLARCADAAEHVLANPDAFRDAAELDATSWSG